LFDSHYATLLFRATLRDFAPDICFASGFAIHKSVDREGRLAGLTGCFPLQRLGLDPERGVGDGYAE
jgi:hypothetical protein